MKIVKLKTLVASVAALSVAGIASADGHTTYKFGGYAKADFFFTDYKDADGEQNVFLDPRTVPLDDGTNTDPEQNIDKSTEFDTSARTSRLNFKATHKTENHGTATGFIEIDFSSTGGNSNGTETATNAHEPALRHAFVKWDKGDHAVLAGQTWSTFMNTGVYPETLDWVGPSAGIVFIRQNQLRYSRDVGGGSFDIALENPASTFGNPSSDGLDTNDESMPDIVLRYNGKSDAVSYALAAIVRDIQHDNGTIDDSEIGVGFSASAKISTGGKNNIKAMVNTGRLGRYQAVAGFNDGVVSTVDGSIDETTVTGGFIAYQHWLTEQTRVNVLYAMSEADLADSAAPGTNESLWNWSINLLTSPIPKLTYGVELMQAGRETDGGSEGEATRLQFSTKFAF